MANRKSTEVIRVQKFISPGFRQFFWNVWLQANNELDIRIVNEQTHVGANFRGKGAIAQAMIWICNQIDESVKG